MPLITLANADGVPVTYSRAVTHTQPARSESKVAIRIDETIGSGKQWDSVSATSKHYFQFPCPENDGTNRRKEKKNIPTAARTISILN